MTLILDTSILIDLERKRKSTLERLSELCKNYPDTPKIAFITLFEILLGSKEKNKTNQQKCLEFVKQFTVLQTSTKTAPILAELKYKYDQKGIPLSLSDSLIAALAIENGLILVTKDKDFNNITEIRKIILN
ncbi:type II toxin-antitoxin system VapC family toxin [Candidatus Woesearchaeota archaeon]|nr:type II toxin-antitoxin system VapC family toxin [Candidatus Woesearchaeota archaeon]